MRFHPFSLTSMLANSMWERLVQNSHPTARGFPDPPCHWPALYQIEHLPPYLFRCRWHNANGHSCLPMAGVRNASGCDNLITFDLMTVDSFHPADILYLSLSSREVLCRQSSWQRWSFQQFKCSHSLMLEEWPGCFDKLFSVRNVSCGCHLLVLSARFILCSKYILASLPPVLNIMHLGHFVWFCVHLLSLHFWVVFCICQIQCWF